MMVLQGIDVREAQPTDSSSLDVFVAQTVDECLGDMLSPDEVDAYARTYQARRTDEKYYVAHAHGALAGYAVVNASNLRSPCGRVRRLYVSHSAHEPSNERAVAAALVAAIYADRQVPVPTAMDTGALTALGLYDRWGFVDVEALTMCLNSSSSNGRMLASNIGFDR